MEQIFESVKEIEKEISCFLSDDSDVAESIMIENAAMSLEQHVLKIADSKKKSVLIMCGSGNNGADGYTLARRLFGKCKINLLQCEDPKSLHCKKSFENLQSLIKKSYADKNSDKTLIGLFALKDKEVKGTLLEKVIEKSDVIVDCIFGTGFHGTVEEKYQNLFKVVNHAQAKRIACDIPSGLSGTSGLRSDGDGRSDAGLRSDDCGRKAAVCKTNTDNSTLSSMTPQELKRNLFFADKTISMGAHKIGLFADAAKDAVGKLIRAEIGVSDEFFFRMAENVFQTASNQQLTSNQQLASNQQLTSNQQPVSITQPASYEKLYLLEKSDAKLPERKSQNTHKGNFGHTCIISGTKCGAAILSAEAALKTGTGLSTIYAIDSSKTAEFKIDPSVMISEGIPSNANAFVLGPGFGRDDSAKSDENKANENKSCKSQNKNELFKKYLDLIKEKNTAVVLDADSFYYDDTVKFLKDVCSSDNANQKECEIKTSRVVLTPHPKEFSELLKRTGFSEYSVKEITETRITLAREFSKKYPSAVLILKGANTIIASNGTICICTLGSPSLSKAGSGDVLTGIIAALLAQNYSALDAAITATIMHATASTKCTNNYSQTAENLIDNL